MEEATITLQGKGAIHVVPDVTRLEVKIDQWFADYGKAYEQARENSAWMVKILEYNKKPEKLAKTVRLDIGDYTENEYDDDGNFIRTVKKGYTLDQRIKIDLPIVDPADLEKKIEMTLRRGELAPKVIIAVDLFGLPADYPAIRRIASQYGLLILEDGAQGFGGAVNGRRNCSFGDISTTSFFPGKPLGCYGDGGACFTDNDEWAALMDSYRMHEISLCCSSAAEIAVSLRTGGVACSAGGPAATSWSKASADVLRKKDLGEQLGT